MDPNATLHELRAELANNEPDIERVQELFEALDTWITGNGFLPFAWTVAGENSLRRRRTEK